MQSLLNIFSLSASYVCFAIGLSLVFGVMRVINFAHGDFYMIGAYLTMVSLTLLEPQLGIGGAYAVGCLAAAAIMGLMGVALNASIVKPLSDRPLSIFVATLAFSYILQFIVVQVFGPVGQSVRSPLPGIYSIDDSIIPRQRVVVIGVAVFIVCLTWYLLQHTRTGRAIRAVSQNSRGAMLQGISVRKMGALALVVGSMLAGLAGAAMAPVAGVNPFMGVDTLWKAFIVIIVGGIGSIWGSVAAAIIFGTFDTLISSAGYGRLLALFDALIMLAVLAIKPSGLFGERD